MWRMPIRKCFPGWGFNKNNEKGRLTLEMPAEMKERERKIHDK